MYGGVDGLSVCPSIVRKYPSECPSVRLSICPPFSRTQLTFHYVNARRRLARRVTSLASLDQSMLSSAPSRPALSSFLDRSHDTFQSVSARVRRRNNKQPTHQLALGPGNPFQSLFCQRFYYLQIGKSVLVY